VRGDDKHWFHLGYQPALDGIRAVAVIAVMLYHFGAPVAHGGFLGVDAFFVLSGFLITALLVEERTRSGTISFRGFYARRALRLLPALLVMLAAAGVVAATIAPPSVRAGTERGIVFTLLYVANWQKVFSSQSVGILGHTWSLSIEEQFYVLWPPLLFLLLRRGLSLRRLTVVAAALALGSAGTRALLLLAHAASTESLYNGLHTRADSLLIGCAAALAMASGLIPAGKWPRPIRLAVGVALPLMLCLCMEKAGLDDPSWYYFGFLLFASAVALLVVGLVSGQVGNAFLQWKPLVWIGARSYGLYLWHLPVHETLKILAFANDWPWLPYLAINLIPSFALAALSYRLVEAPALRLKRRFSGRAPSAERAQTRLAPAYALVRIE
jgi:peptidoglycan/LPS O-acetylase OafA/YrhL